MNEIIEKISKIIPTLPRAEKVIAEALIETPTAIENMTLSRISKESGTSEASIIRFCRRMGYSGYTSLKNDFIIANRETASLPDIIHINDSMTVIFEKLYKNNLQSLAETLAIPENDYEEAMGALLNAKSIHFFAVGDALDIAKRSYIRFKRIGVLSSAEEDVMLQLITASNLTKKDVAIAVSYEGRTKNVVEAMKIAKQRGATTISITNRRKSPLLEYTDIRLFVVTNDLTVGRDKVTRRISDQFILDGLYLGYESRSGKDHTERKRQTQQAIDCNKI